MGIKYKTKINKLPEVSETLESISGRKVKIGALKGEHAWLAGIHEYGVNIPVTPKMRAFLHYQGVHLSPDTKVIKIPERSFLRTGHDKNADRIMKQTDRAISLVVDGKMSVDDMLDMVGEQFATAIKEYMGQTKPNSELTIKMKGSSTPLTGLTGALVNSIMWEKE